MVTRTTRACILLAFGAVVGLWLCAWMPAAAEPLGADATQPAAGPKIQEIEDAVALFNQRDFDGALALLETAAKKHTDLPPAPVMMAQLFARANVAAGVRHWLERAVKDVPNDPEAYAILGNFALSEGRVTEADLLFSKASTLLTGFQGSAKRKDALLPRVNAGLATVAEFRQDWTTAQKHLEAWLAVDPKNAEAMQRMARAMFQQKDAAKALDYLKKAKAAESSVLTPEAQLALFYEDYGDHANAVKWMQEALRVAPNDVPTHLAVARWALLTGDLDKAKEQAAMALQQDPQSLDAKIMRGIVALFQKDYKAAELYFEGAHLQSPGNFAASNNLAIALAEQNDPAKQRRAVEYAAANVRQNPNNQNTREALSTYGWTLYKVGQLDEADQVLQRVARTGLFDPDTAYYIARVAADKGRTEEAKRLLAAALNSKRPFSQEQEAKALLERLNR